MMPQQTIPAKRNSWKLYIGLVLIAVIAVASWFAASYYLQLNRTPGQVASNEIQVHMLLNYGNGTLAWSNSTLQPGRTLYNETLVLVGGRVESQYSSSFGHFIVSINGIKPPDGYYWTLFLYCTNDRAWMSSNWGADSITQTNATSVASTAAPIQVLRSNAFAWSVLNSNTFPSPPYSGAPLLPSDKSCS